MAFTEMTNTKLLKRLSRIYIFQFSKQESYYSDPISGVSVVRRVTFVIKRL